MRVVRFYVSLRRNCQLPMAVFPPGPQPRAPDGSVPTWTSTASSEWQCAHPDLNCELPTAMFPTGPQPVRILVPCRQLQLDLKISGTAAWDPSELQIFLVVHFEWFSKSPRTSELPPQDFPNLLPPGPPGPPKP